ncbi:MAG: DEAD/DEAH box helicase family protein [Verrucomicrobia bacterium]|nr:DEAD/DEAH box helicase family protein [Verrucomicrobiota bacterium]
MMLPLVKALSPRVQAECAGLESGNAPILEKVTPVTADLLRWWFQQDCIDGRGVNFHEGQRQAILHAIYAHEVLQPETLVELYQKLAAEDLLTARRMEEVVQSKHPKYCLKMATGTGKTWVLQALLYWQLLNAARAPEDKRFTRNFLAVAPGLIVYGRLLDAFLGKERDGQRDFNTSDLACYKDLFVPDTYRDEIFRFVQGNVCTKEDLGTKITAGGLIGICNWHALAEADEPEEDDTIETPGLVADPKQVAASALPLSPGTSAGNSLEVLNRRFERGGTLAYLREMPSLLVFNDEAHHIHELRSEGEITEVEWQKSLRKIAETKGSRFLQVDFSATPYNQVGSGVKAKAVYFPHIIADFDLRAAMKAGLVKSLVLDKRRELGALANDELQFKADRDEHGRPILSEGQRIMVRAGVAKLMKLEKEFAAIDATRHPKMMVVCEDTTVTPLVVEFLISQGLNADEILQVDSNRKGELPEAEWAVLREKLFDMDAHPKPRVVISVLMLREGFDVNNICVIVPLRTTGAKILLEQTVGRGLRLMWRGNEFDDQKKENRALIKEGQEPKSLIDVLSIVEHPKFAEFYEQLRQDGYEFAVATPDDPAKRSTGDLIPVELRDGYEQFDFAVPFIMREMEEEFVGKELDVTTLARFGAMTFEQLKAAIGKGDVFRSEDVQTRTQFGDYRVDGGIMTATGYNDFLSRLVRRIAESLSAPVTGSSQVFANISRFPFLQVNLPQLSAWVDEFIRRQLFGREFNPFEDENWRLLCLDPVANHIIREFGRKLPELADTQTTAEPEIKHRRLSEVAKITVRESCSIETPKCIYERLPYPSRNGGFELAFMQKAVSDATVEAFCKVNEQKHLFMRLRYVKENGLPGFYSPDFLVRTQTGIWLVETKRQDQLTQADVIRKKTAAVAWCERVNELSPEDRAGRTWNYCLLGEALFYEFRDKTASMEEIVQFSRVRAKTAEKGSLFD